MSKKARQQLPSYRRHKASGRAVVTLNHKDFYLGAYGSRESRREYHRLIAEWISNGRQLPGVVGLGSLKIVEQLAAYLTFAKTYCARDGKPTKEYVSLKDAAKPLRILYPMNAKMSQCPANSRDRSAA